MRDTFYKSTKKTENQNLITVNLKGAGAPFFIKSIYFSENGKNFRMKNPESLDEILKIFAKSGDVYECKIGGVSVRIKFNSDENAPDFENLLVKIAAKKLG